MKNLLFIKLVVFLLSAFIFSTAQAFVVYDPSNWIQNSMTAANTAKELVNQAEELKIALADMKNYQGNVGEWADIQILLQKLGDQIQQGQALSYTMRNLDSEFQAHFPGFTPVENYQQSYDGWSKTTLDTLRGTLDSIGFQANQFANEQTTINTLKNLSQTATGRMQAVQVGNMIATQQVAQLQQLRQLVMAQVNSENTYAAAKVQKDATNEAAVSNWVNNSETKFPVYGAHATQ